MTTKKELEQKLKCIASVGKLATRVWQAGVENQWKTQHGYISILMQLGDWAAGKHKLPKGYIRDLRRQTNEYINIRKAKAKAILEAL